MNYYKILPNLDHKIEQNYVFFLLKKITNWNSHNARIVALWKFLPAPHQRPSQTTQKKILCYIDTDSYIVHTGL